MRLCDGREVACWGFGWRIVERTKECYASFGLRGGGDWRLPGGEDSHQDDERNIGEKRDGCHDSTPEAPRSCVMLDLRIIQRHSLFGVRSAHMSRARYGHKRSDPPQGEENETNVKAPGVWGRRVFVIGVEVWYPGRWVHARWPARVPHMVRAGATERGRLRRDDSADRDRAI